MIIPLDYQSFLKVKNTRTNVELKSSSFAGLLKVDKGVSTKRGDHIAISIKPDRIMMISVFLTWISIIATISICLMPLIEKLRKDNS